MSIWTLDERNCSNYKLGLGFRVLLGNNLIFEYMNPWALRSERRRIWWGMELGMLHTFLLIPSLLWLLKILHVA